MYEAAESALSRSERWHSGLLRIWWENKRRIQGDLSKATKKPYAWANSIFFSIQTCRDLVSREDSCCMNRIDRLSSSQFLALQIAWTCICKTLIVNAAQSGEPQAARWLGHEGDDGPISTCKFLISNAWLDVPSLEERLKCTGFWKW